MSAILITIIVFAVIFFLSMIKVVYQYERGVRLFLGRFSGIMNPGLRIIIPGLHKWHRVDMRTRVIDVPDQDCITKDNVSLNVNAVIYYRVVESMKAIIEVEHYSYAISQLAQTTMRDVVGEVDLDQLLSKRDELSNRIQALVDKATDPWGIKIESVDLKHIELPENLKRTMAKEAEAEREKRAVILKADGEVKASLNMSKAATILSKADGALHLRTLQTLNDISSDQTNHIVFFAPLDIMNSIEGKPGRWLK
jgi:regulator of protease activity HflC (stomatin/prohibitin superfamily)